MCSRVAGVELDCPTILALGSRPIVIELEENMRQRSVRLRQRAVELQRPHRSALGLREGLTWCEAAVPTTKDPGIGDPHPGTGIAGVQVDRPLEVVERGLDVPFRALVPEVPALQVERVCLVAPRRLGAQPIAFAFEQRDTQPLDHLLSDVRLYRKDVVDLPIVGRCPELSFVLGTEELESRSEEHTSELQSRSDLVCRLLLEKKKT